MNIRILNWLSRTLVASVVFGVLWLAHQADQATIDGSAKLSVAAGGHHQGAAASAAGAQPLVIVSR